jgi:hypothetical protein
VFGEWSLSSPARELLARERGLKENEALKSRAISRARAALDRDRLSGIRPRLLDCGSLGVRPRRVWRTPALIAAASCAVGLAAAGAGLYLWKAPETDARPPPGATARQSQPPHMAVGGALLPIASVQGAPEERPPEPRAASPGAARTADDTRSLSVKQYATELRLLEPARSSLSRGDYAAALAALGQHRREFPDGQLSQEREALRVRALWGLGQKPAAMAAASAFRKRYPRSPLLSWLKDQGAPAP